MYYVMGHTLTSAEINPGLRCRRLVVCLRGFFTIRVLLMWGWVVIITTNVFFSVARICSKIEMGQDDYLQQITLSRPWPLREII